MRVAVKKIEGVEAVEVSLNRGEAVIRFKADNRVTVEQVRQAIRRNGFTPKDADVRLQGRAIEQDGGLALALPERDRIYFLVDHPDAAGVLAQIRAGALGRTVWIDGVIPETPRRAEPVDTVQVRSFALPPGT